MHLKKSENEITAVRLSKSIQTQF